MITIQNKHDCCGCGACMQHCPKQCITMQEDSEGFMYPQVDEATCIECGLCEKMCPLIQTVEKRQPIEVLAVKNTNEAVRMNSSSGGVFFPLAQQSIAKSGVVFGAAFTTDWQVVITHAESIEQVRPMMGSKYLQASTGTAFRDAERFLKEGREVLFSGTPCQIAGLHKYLRGKDYPNLLTVDFLCHGVPSPGVWRKYLEEVKQNLSARRASTGKDTVSSFLNDMPSLEDIAFREKQLHGWKKFSFVVRGKSAYLAGQNSVLLSDIHRENPYMRGFLNDIYLRPSCYGCRCKNGVSHSDITIADFWGIETLMPDFDDDKGVGLVLLSSEKGQKAFYALPNMVVRPSTIEDAKRTNDGFNEKLRPHPQRAAFYQAMQQGKPVTDIVTRLLQTPLKQRVIRLVKRIIKKHCILF